MAFIRPMDCLFTNKQKVFMLLVTLLYLDLGISAHKQERLLSSRPEIVVGTPGRLWEFIAAGHSCFENIKRWKINDDDVIFDTHRYHNIIVVTTMIFIIFYGKTSSSNSSRNNYRIAYSFFQRNRVIFSGEFVFCFAYSCQCWTSLLPKLTLFKNTVYFN